jgi:hypothetical protein
MNIPRPGDPRLRPVTLVDTAGRRTTGRITWQLAGADYLVVLDGPLGRLESVERDYFEALVAIRRRLEPAGWWVAVQGARRTTYPSGVLRAQGGARNVYVLELGRPAQRAHRAMTFDDADPADLGTVDEQKDFYERWLGSVFGDDPAAW